ncbi:MAG TPA: DUF58 domain-containing protein [Longimicrobiales bacterium]|nr:DUF58 domain-containing protein [Longimicrobiales bacterium]
MRMRHSAEPVPGTGFIDPAVLARIGNLQLVARNVVDGFINGLHRAPWLGLSLDFAEHRAYMPGDDIRRIDWRLYARTDRYHVKEFEADTNANFVVLLDTSASMGWASGAVTKFDYARFLAASLAYFSHQQRDRVGVITFGTDIVDYVPASARHMDVLLHTVDRSRAGGGSDLTRALRSVNELLRRRGLVVLISDLYDDPARVLAAVSPLRFRGHDVIVFHVLDPAELDLPFDDALSLEDVETEEQLPVVPDQLRLRYRELVRTHCETLEREFTNQRIDYALLDTSQPLDHALFSYLAARERLSRSR